MTLRKEINHEILQAVNTKYNYSSSDIKVKRIQDTTDQICSIIKERLEEPLAILRTESRSILTAQMTTEEWLQMKRSDASRELDNLIKELS